MRILALDTATEACSCALYVEGTCEELHELAPRRHAELILPMVTQLLETSGLSLSQLDGIAFGRGPGSFTGIRIAAGIAQGFAFGAGVPIIPVSTLMGLAQGGYRAFGEEKILVAIDARMQQVYWGGYRLATRGVMTTTIPECVKAPPELPLPGGPGWYGVGNGWRVYHAALHCRLRSKIHGWTATLMPHAQDIAVLGAESLAQGGGLAPEKALPIYLRDGVADNKPHHETL